MSAKTNIILVSKMNPEVSIITPAYNVSKTIKETFDSILSQSFSSWEWIIIEDHSTDGSYEYIQKMIKGEPRAILLQTEKNSGAAVSRNIGIENARGRFIAFLDADDMWKPDKLEKQVSFMKDNNYPLTYTDYDLLFENGKTKQYCSKNKFATYKSLLRTNDIGCLTAMYDTEKLGKYYMPLDCEKREDHGMWLDITRNGLKAIKMPECLSIYRVGQQTVSSKKRKMIKYQYLLYRKHEHFNFFKSVWYLIICSYNKVFKKY